MSSSASSPTTRNSLRLLASPHALDFSSRLLDRGTDGILTFREFVATAREFVHEQPDRSAIYLAALVALDIGAPDEDELREPLPPPAPSRN